MPSLFDRVFRREPAPQVAEPGSLVDHAKRQVNEVAGRAYRWIAERSPWVAQRIDDVVSTANDMERSGYNRHFGDFNTTLTRPLTQGLSDVVTTVQATATCAPHQNARSAFEMWNVYALPLIPSNPPAESGDGPLLLCRVLL